MENKRIKLLVLLFSLQALASSAQDFIVTFAQSAYLGKTYDSILRTSDLAKAPHWDPEKGPPPLSPKAAVKIATAEVLSQLGEEHLGPVRPFPTPNYKSWITQESQLVEARESGIWFYRIKLTPVAPGSTSYYPVTVLVTLGGKVIPLVPRKDTGP